ncbi:MAG: DeoR/GlpR transcriptional regulator [Clostridia bacterium]|nr:DeoR/GlpR transcriptional regulator [Clostridia bacterium]
MNVFRRQIINDYIQANGKATYDELMELVQDVSCMTLRRDLEILEKDGQIVRVRGGARSVTSVSNDGDDKYAIRAAANVAAKMDVVEKTLPFIEPDHSMYFDSGSTMMLLASKVENGYYSITTCAPNVAIELMKKSKTDVTLLGGRLNRDTLAVSGISSIKEVEDINIDTAIMATSGYSEDFGFTSSSYDEAQLKKAVIKKARKVIMIMDSTKLGKNLQYTFAHLSDVDMLILSSCPDDELIELCNKMEIQLIY